MGSIENSTDDGMNYGKITWLELSTYWWRVQFTGEGSIWCYQCSSQAKQGEAFGFERRGELFYIWVLRATMDWERKQVGSVTVRQTYVWFG